jgi:hypothetical protein
MPLAGAGAKAQTQTTLNLVPQAVLKARAEQVREVGVAMGWEVGIQRAVVGKGGGKVGVCFRSMAGGLASAESYRCKVADSFRRASYSSTEAGWLNVRYHGLIASTLPAFLHAPEPSTTGFIVYRRSEFRALVWLNMN